MMLRADVGTSQADVGTPTCHLQRWCTIAWVHIPPRCSLRQGSKWQACEGPCRQVLLCTLVCGLRLSVGRWVAPKPGWCPVSRGVETKYLVRTLVQNLRVGANWRSVVGPVARATLLHR
jgi:hypothetical protein